MGDIIKFNGETTQDMDAETVLSAAIDEGVQDAIVLGYDKDGGFYFASSIGGGGDIMWLLETAKLLLLRIAEERNK